MKRIVILISGRGSNMEAIVRACAAEGWPAAVVAVLSNRPEAAGLAWAAGQGIATAALDHRQYADRAAFDTALAAEIDRHAPDLVVLAGFMRILTPAFVQRYDGRLLNIHPSLLPSFRGADAHVQALAAGVRISGCTVHLVRPEMDTGPILLQGLVPVLPGDTVETLSRRTLEVEHVCYPRALELMASGRVTVEAGRALAEGIEPQRLLVRHPLLDRG